MSTQYNFSLEEQFADQAFHEFISGDQAKAVDMYKMLIKISPLESTYHVMYAIGCNDDNISIKHYEIAMKLNPSVTTKLAYINHWLEKSRFIKVKSLFQTIKSSEVKQQLVITQAKYNGIKSILLLMFNAKYSALKYFKKSMYLYSTIEMDFNAVLMKQAHIMLHRLGKYNESLKMLTLLHTKTVKTDQFLLTEAVNYFQLEQYKEAKKHLALFINKRQRPMHDLIEGLLMCCEINLHHWNKAKKLYISRKSSSKFNVDPTNVYFWKRYNSEYNTNSENANWNVFTNHPHYSKIMHPFDIDWSLSFV
eukprot:44431_1